MPRSGGGEAGGLSVPMRIERATLLATCDHLMAGHSTQHLQLRGGEAYLDFRGWSAGSKAGGRGGGRGGGEEQGEQGDGEGDAPLQPRQGVPRLPLPAPSTPVAPCNLVTPHELAAEDRTRAPM